MIFSAILYKPPWLKMTRLKIHCAVQCSAIEDPLNPSVLAPRLWNVNERSINEMSDVLLCGIPSTKE